MNIHFLGAGEACDPDHPNTSVLVQYTAQKNKYILFDCGFTTPHRFFSLIDKAELPDTLWISHFHGDHFFGVPLLLLRLAEMGRSVPLTIAGPAGIKKIIHKSMDLAYPGFRAKLFFPLVFKELMPPGPYRIDGITWRTAANEHSQHALSVRIDTESGSLFYSGDGRPTPASTSLARHCDLAIHEAFAMEPSTPGHGSIRGCITFAEETGVQRLALVHLSRETRKTAARKLDDIAASDGRIFLPKAGNEFELSQGRLQKTKWMIIGD